MALTIFIGLAGMVIYILFFSRLFLLKKIECNGCSDVVTAELAKDVGKNVFRIKRREISNKLLKSDLTLATVEIKIKLPSGLIANLEKRSADFRLTNDALSGNYLLVDNQGVVLDRVDGDLNSDLLILVWSGAENMNIGNKTPDDVVRGAEILNLLKDRYNFGGKGNIEDNYLMVKIINGPLVRFGLDKETTVKIRELQLAMDQARIDLLKPKEIDLRFNNPIVVN